MVSLIGAGPGDERLITVLGRERIQNADVILYDRLISKELLWEAPKDCIKVDVGKIPGNHQVTQDKIQSMLLSYAKQYPHVVRLKGGDPFIFGRGSEEACFLADAGIAFEVVPGVSSLQGATAYSGIPLTHRGVSAGFHVFTGHGRKRQDFDFQTMAKLPGTILFFMAVKNMRFICEQLILAGKAPDTPTAVIFQGTTGRQKVTVSTLGQINEFTHENPSLLVIGEVAALQDQLDWFQQKVLFGKRIVITRPFENSQSLRMKLRDLGADVISFPAIQIVPKENDPLAPYLAALPSYQWILFTSANSIQVFFQMLFAKGLDARALQNIKLFAIGPGTEAALLQYGLKADVTLGSPGIGSLAEFVAGFIQPGDLGLYPTSNLTGGHVENCFQKKNARLHKVVTYETKMPALDEDLKRTIQNSENDFVVFGSPSQVNNYIKAVGVIKGIPVAYGEKTAAELHKNGYLKPLVSAAPHTGGIAECIINHVLKGE